jgi:Fe-Mn family superoxide dismutase
MVVERAADGTATSRPPTQQGDDLMNDLSRRDFLIAAGAGAAALAVVHLTPLSLLAEDKKATGFTLPKLPYAYDALEPHIDAETMMIHHDKHHQAYVNNLNKALDGQTKFLAMTPDELMRDIKQVPEDIRQAVTNNGGGHANHSLFWTVMKKDGGGEPKGDLSKAIDKAFGSFDKFQTKLSTAATTRFGSGWGWLVLDKGDLNVISSANQDSPLMTGATPILGIDVWEHAYYLKYRNLRPDYIKAWWKTVNWEDVAERYNAAKKG